MSANSRSRKRSAIAALAASAVAFGGSAALLSTSTGVASSHREAPLIIDDPLLDNTDVYAFVSPDKSDTVTLISNWLPFQEPGGGPNFYPFAEDALHYIRIDNDGDAKADISYRWKFKNVDKRGTKTFLFNNGPVTSFDDENLLFKQTYTLEVLDGEGNVTTLLKDAPTAPSHVGDASMPNYAELRAEAVVDFEGGGKSFAGQADDPFFADLRVFDLLYGGDLSERGSDTLTGFNINSIGLQVPVKNLTKDGDPVIGVWSTTERPSMRVHNADGSVTTEGEFVQVSRLGNPLVNEVVFPAGLKDAFNALEPHNDASVQLAVDRVLDPELPKLIEKIYGIPAPEAPRKDLFSIFLTGVKGLNMPEGKVQPAELLRLNTSIEPADEPSRLGVLAKDTSGFPNGRRLADDVVDIELQALEGAVRTGKIVEPLAEGDLVNTNDKAFGDSFPYVALPHSGSKVRPGTTGEGQDPSGGANAGAGGTAGEATAAAPAAAPVVAPVSGPASSPLLPAGASVLGVGFGLLGLGLLRRNRTRSTGSTSGS